VTTPFYVSPEQQMKDRADYARKGIARGRSVVVLAYTEGILFVAENPSRALHKISEIYDRIVFAAVGKYNEFENLRIAGVRLADLRGYSYDRRDVTGRGLANAYAQTLGTIFSSPVEKPYEVEIVVAEVGDTVEEDQIYRLTYDGSVADEHGFVVMGGSAEQISSDLQQRYRDGMDLSEALNLAVAALGRGRDNGESRQLTPGLLEVAVLDRNRPLRKFKRIIGPQLAQLLHTPESTEPGDDTPPGGEVL
jgi:proteasome alpha subunit